MNALLEERAELAAANIDADRRTETARETDSIPVIRQLPPSVVNKIAAGEVIERPASVVKELMENSVDAGATRIDVSVETGGIDLVRVADNGCGIRPEQLVLAVASHATSKIRDADDLFHVGTLGFRGEALASIAEISRFLIRSRTGAESAGAEIVVDGGRSTPPAPCGCPVGTIIEVRQLFFNTPVRKKFLRATQTEMGHVSEAFTRIALAFPQVHFTLRHNERPVYDLPPVASWRERIAGFFQEFADSLIAIDSDDGAIRLHGFAVDPSHSRSNNRMQYLFLNGRYIRDRSLQHALSEAYRGLLLTGRFPIVFLRMEIPPADVDVNVHPTKLEVRFQDGGRIYSQLLAALRQKFLGTDLTAKVGSRPLAGDNDPAAALDENQAAAHRQKLTEWAKGESGGAAAVVPPLSPEDEDLAELARAGFARPPSSAPVEPRFDLAARPSPPHQPGLGLTYDRISGRVPEFRLFPDGGGGLGGPRIANQTPASPPAHASYESHSPPTPAAPPFAHTGLQIHNRYLITENEVGVVIIDQHALHERVLYEQLREKMSSGTLEKQRLLVPEAVALPPAEAAAAIEAREALAGLGIDVEPFGGDTVLVSSFPAMLANFNPAEVLRELIEGLISGGKTPDRRDLLDEMLHMIACKAAIKAGDRLTAAEVTALLEQRHLFQDTHHCPHGRPTSLVFSREELDKRFKRT